MATMSSPLTSHVHFGGRYGHDSIFQPPKASPSTRLSASMATGDYFSSSARKRQRSDSSQKQDGAYSRQSSWTASPGYGQFSAIAENMSASGFDSAASLVNDRYTLAGGFDTPSLQAASLFDGLSTNQDQLFTRGQMRDVDVVGGISFDQALLSGPLARERNGVARINLNPGATSPSSWTSFALGLMGKMFTFGGSMIRGFYAGGGKGYDLHGVGAAPPYASHNDQGDCSTPIPGAWDFGQLTGDCEKNNPAFDTPSVARPPNKRRQTDRDTWVMIGTPDTESTPMSPSRKPSNVARNAAPNRPGASRANSRRSTAPVLNRAQTYTPQNGSPGQTVTSAVSSHERRASIASVRSPHGRPNNTTASTAVMSPEAERFMRRQVKQERAADKAMNSMSRRLEDLIRQGQQALGTKYSVEGGDGMMEDEGFVDEIY